MTDHDSPPVITLCKSCNRLWEIHAARWSHHTPTQLTEGPVSVMVAPDACDFCRSYVARYVANIPKVDTCPCCSLLPQEHRNLNFARWRIVGRRSSLGEPLQIQQVIRLAEYDLLLTT